MAQGSRSSIEVEQARGQAPGGRVWRKEWRAGGERQRGGAAHTTRETYTSVFDRETQSAVRVRGEAESVSEKELFPFFYNLYLSDL